MSFFFSKIFNVYKYLKTVKIVTSLNIISDRQRNSNESEMLK